MEYLESQRADVVLVSPELYENPMTKKTLATFFLLMDGRERLIPEGVPMIRKYQKADDIIRAILKEYERRPFPWHWLRNCPEPERYCM